MHYSDELDHILKKQLEILIQMTMDMSGPFRPGFAQHWYHVYQQITHK